MAFANPVRPGIWRNIMLADGRVVKAELKGDEYLHYWQTELGERFVQQGDVFVSANMHDLEAQAKGMQSVKVPWKRKNGNLLDGCNNSLWRGKKKFLVLLAQFPDIKFKAKDPRAFFDQVMNKKGFNEEGYKECVGEYFKTQSNGLFEPEFDVCGPFVVKEKSNTYEDGYEDRGAIENGERLTREVCEMASKSGIDFSKYDYDNDGFAESVIVIYSGKFLIWPHSSTGYHQKIGKAAVHSYVCVNELKRDLVDEETGEITRENEYGGIGTICHEFCHNLGLDDRYLIEEYNLGWWSLMSMGDSSQDGFVPGGLTAYEKMDLGWTEPVDLTLTKHLQVNHLKILSEGGNAYIVRNPGCKDEYYLLENRREGFTDWMMDHGLLIYHVLKDGNIYVAPAYTDGDWWLCRYWPFPNNDKNEFSNTTQPNDTLFEPNADGTHFLNIRISNITKHDDGSVSFTFDNMNDLSGIDAISDEDNKKNHSSDTYNLAGQKVGKEYKGIIINHGKKIIR